MKLKNITFSEIFDQFAIRIVVEKVEECYMILGMIHQIYTPIQDRFKDYIAMPKVMDTNPFIQQCLVVKVKLLKFKLEQII